MEQLGKTEFELVEPEASYEESAESDAEARASRRMMRSLLNYATSQGMCGSAEASMWLDSFDMAEDQAQRDELIDIFQECLAYGEEWLQRVHEVLASRILSTDERRGVERLMDVGDFKERDHELRVVERQLEKAEKTTVPKFQQQAALLARIASSSIVKSFEDEFRETELERKGDVVKKMERYAEVTVGKPVQAENAGIKDALAMIRRLLLENNFVEARRWLNQLWVAEGSNELFRTWSATVDASEIKFVRQNLPEAA